MTDHQDAKINRIQGIAVSSGIIIGKARLVDRSREKIIYEYLIQDDQVNREVEKFKEALHSTKEQILSLKNNMPDQIKKHAFILDTHLMIMDDSMITDSTINTILEEKINAEWALKKSIQKIRQLFEQADYEYVRDRINDVVNIGERILRNLAGKEQESLSEIGERVIIVAHDLSPADTSEINIGKVMGFITDVGGRTSHTAIMAQALEIPAVVGLKSVTRQVQDGTLLIVDGYTGEVIIGPDDDTIIAYQEKELQHERYRSSIIQLGHLPAETVDGHRLTIKANIEFSEEVVSAKDHGAEGIGLYRTEFLYLRSKGIPSEEELFEDYKQVTEIFYPLPVTIRTLDLGGDKFSSDLDLSREMNPALGLRAIRFCLKEPKIFKKQLRAILRASAYGQLQLMFPMISGLQEILDTKKILKEVMHDLDNENINYDRDIKTGIMIEIPSAVIVADILAKHVDFFSIGTNDLIQYALAIDRVNDHLAYMYEPYHPAILRMIQQVVKAAKDTGIKVALCGEMAGDPFCATILLGLGIDELSMNAASIPLDKKIIRSISMKEALSDLKDISQFDTAKEVREFIIEKIEPLIPDEVEKDFYLKTSAKNSILR
ncbi:MAG: phosphoenolpyruvate--protein phosphotransferase [Deltaproteobacteria bacterium]|nr:phosphoenolpyruvate--protein phosphotransferase [Deltaproteobacteria bacterium]